jgi:pyruvate dehydrogenase E2 component (dihydrolipoamide acetyltransferase)
MTMTVVMPDLDPEMKSGRIAEWLKREGEAINRGEPMVRVEVEKISFEVDSPYSGTLSEILVELNEDVVVGAPIARISTKASLPSPLFSTASSPAQAASGPREVAGKRERGAPFNNLSKRIRPEAMRSAIAEKMSRSWREIPQVSLATDFELDALDSFRASLEGRVKKRVSFTAIVARAVASALASFEELNSTLEGGEIVQFQDVDVSIAVALDPRGLVTPVVRAANLKSVLEISDEIEDLASRARSGKLTLGEVTGGTITVSNLSSYGVDSFIPIINPPQVCIVGVGQRRERSYNYKNDAKEKKDGHPGGPTASVAYCTVTIVFDHRVTDGARAARFLQEIKRFIENPDLL